MSDDGHQRQWVCLGTALVSMAALTCGGRMAEITPGEPPLTILLAEDLIPGLQDAICSAADQCCDRAGWSRSPDCRGAVRSHWQPILDHARAVGAVFDRNTARRCVDQTEAEWSRCESSKTASSTADAICGRVFAVPSPRKAPGQPCEAAMDCIQDEGPTVICLRVGESEGISGICLRNLASESNGPCGGAFGDTYANCSAPYVCGGDLRCHPPSTLGQSCSSFGSDTCGAASVCDVGGKNLCRGAVAVGQACSSAHDCENFACLGGLCRVYPDLSLSWYCQERLPLP